MCVSVRVSIHPKDGSYETFRQWEVVADDVVMESPDRQLRLMDQEDRRQGRWVVVHLHVGLIDPPQL